VALILDTGPLYASLDRSERASIAVAPNLPFGEWGSVFPDVRLAAAVVDRLTYRSRVIETGSESYRLRASQGLRTGGAKA
jgi:DNA replication protein DnaC